MSTTSEVAGGTTTTLFPTPSPSPVPASATASAAAFAAARAPLAASSSIKHKLLKTTAVVFDLGDAYLKIGFAGESSPRHILPTSSLLLQCRPHSCDSPDLARLNPKQRLAASQELTVSRNLLVNPYHTPTHLYALFSSLLRSLYFHHLHVNPKDRRVLLLESHGWSQAIKRAIVQTLYEMEVPAVCFRPAMECALYAVQPTAGYSSALLVDCGWSETRLLPVYLGHPLHHLMRIIPLGMWDVHRRFITLIQPLLRMEYAQNGGDLDHPYYLEEEEKLFTAKAIEKFLSTMCYVQPFQLAFENYMADMKTKHLAESSSTNNPPPLPPILSSSAATDLPAPLPIPFFIHAAPPPGSPEYAFPPVTTATATTAATTATPIPPLPSMLTLPALIRFEVFETLFAFDRSSSSSAAIAIAQETTTTPSTESLNDVANIRGSNAEHGLSEAMLELLLDERLPSEVRASLVGNVVLMGGSCMSAGFAERLVDELNWLLGGDATNDEKSMRRAEIVMKRGMQALQNKIGVNTSSSAVTCLPQPVAPAITAAAASATTTAPTASSPFYSNCLAWIGGSIVASFDAIEEDFIPHAEMKPLIAGRVVPLAAVEKKKQSEELRKKKERKFVDAEGTVLQQQESKEQQVETSPASADSSATVTLRPLPIPDWSIESSLVRSAAPKSATAAALASTFSLTTSASYTSGLHKQRLTSNLSPATVSAINMSPSPTTANSQ